MIRRLLLLTCATMLCLAGFAQGNGPKKGDLTLSATVGYNSYVGNSAPTATNEASYEVAALSTDWFDSKLMVGMEGSWFFSDLWSVRLGGGLGFTNNPGYSEVPGTFGDEGPLSNGDGLDVFIPSYRAVADGQTFKYNVYTGIDRHFQNKNLENLYFHVGVHAGFAYGLNIIKYDEEMSMGRSYGEAFNLRGAMNAGATYYFMPGMYFGIEANVFQYTYNMTTIKPQDGLLNLSADSHNYGFLAAPTLKIGFKF